MQNKADTPSVEADVTLATFLSLCIIISFPLNLIALGYFKSQRTGRKNGMFFNRLYMIVAATDALICILQIPTIDSLFHGRNSRAWLFDNKYFCKCWAALKETSVALSIFLVAILSISRLILFKFPNTQLPPCIGWILPSGFMIVHCIVIPPLFAIKYLNARPSESGNFMCYLCGYFEMINEKNETYVSTEHLVNYMVVQSVRTSFAGFPFFPICISFCISMVLLKRSRNRVSTTASVRRQERASSTIILFTSLYVVCNVPLTVYTIYLTSLVADLLHRSSKRVDNRIMFSEYEATFSKSYFERHYIWIIGVNLSIVFNSTLNPILYFWRMKKFRQFVINLRNAKHKISTSSIDSNPNMSAKDSKL